MIDRWLLLIFGMLVIPTSVHGQSVRVAVPRENFRAGPNGTRLATVYEGGSLSAADRRDDWYTATLEGWVWAPSLRPESRDGHDLVIAQTGGENLRVEPNGQRIARLLEGMLLDEVEQRGRWVRVRRSGWIWAASVEPGRDASDSAGGVAAFVDSSAVPPPGDSSGSDDASDTTGRWLQAGSTGGVLLGSPGADTLAHMRSGTPVEIVARDGNWARARVEGWVWLPSLSPAADSGEVLREISAEMLAANPERFRGRLVDWTVQFIALDRADRIRTDFYEGEPFILARESDEASGFIYIAVPPDRLGQVERLTPLERIRVLARIRTAASPLTGEPVLELLELRE